MSFPVAILGAGPAGLGAAYQLATRGLASVTVLEQRDATGGNAGSFEIDGVWADYGSHRLHPSCDPRILAALKELLGEDLLLRPRHGRIRLRERWIHFPLKPLDLMLHLPLSFSAHTFADILSKPFRKATGESPTFASVLQTSLGSTICRDFYFPYARKIWGLEPEELSATQARRRVSGSSPGKMLRKILRSRTSGRFYYPRKGFGEIASRLHDAAGGGGAEFLLGARVTGIEWSGERICAVRYERDGAQMRLEPRHVWSTLPLSLMVRSMEPVAPAQVLAAASEIQFRAMILVYLVLEQKQFTEYDAHYFPEEQIPIARLSEPRNYSAASEPRGITVLCAELPCDTGSAYWRMSDDELGGVVAESLAAAGLPIQSVVRRTLTRRLSHAYPLYRTGYEERFDTIDGWLDGFENLLTFGRQGLFAHDNTHHALFMAWSAVDCLDCEGRFDRERWHAYRRVFESHVVED